MSTTEYGTIKTVNFDRGFGFVETADGSAFFHVSSLRGLDWDERLRGLAVRFTVEKTPKGLRASNVERRYS